MQSVTVCARLGEACTKEACTEEACMEEACTEEACAEYYSVNAKSE